MGTYQHLAGARMEVSHLNQKQLANPWSVSEATLERWRSVGIGPVFLKLLSQVRYRLEDIKAFEESCLATSTGTALMPYGVKVMAALRIAESPDEMVEMVR